MSTTYHILTKAEALILGATEDTVPDLESMYDADGYEGENRGVFRCEDGVPVELLGTDGGEPEDQSFVRDWSWVVGALRATFRRGQLATGNAVFADSLTPLAKLYDQDTLELIDELMVRCAQAMYDDVSGSSEQADALRDVAEILGIEGPHPRLDRLYEAD